jgi:hypothetical protein
VSLLERESPRLRDAAEDLTRGDYYLACAASMLEKTSRDDLRDEADRLMRECIALRERIYSEIGR